MGGFQHRVDGPKCKAHETPKTNRQIGDVDTHRSTALSILITLTSPL